MRRFLPILIGALVAMPVAAVALLFALSGPAGRPAPEAPPVDPAWAGAAVWDDGKAELATYDAALPIYGAERPFTATLITVKEAFDPEALVKAERPGPGSLPVLKLNFAADIPTPNYTYHYLVSVFVRRADPFRAVKQTVGSQEWCGNTFKLLRWSGAAPTLTYHSYFEGQGDGETPVPRDAWTTEQLWLALRGLRFREGVRFTGKVLEPLLTNKAPVRPVVRRATFTVTGRETLSVGDREVATWRVEARSEAGTARTWIGVEPPNLLVKHEGTDGLRLTLRDVTRRQYWKLP